MGVGHLNIGMGQGDAQVFQPSPAIAMYGQILAQRKAKQDQDNKYLNDELAKGYDPTALRNDADKKTYLDKYSQIKQAGIDAENERDPKKKAMAISGVRQQLSDLGSFAEGSKKQGAQERAWASSYQNNPDGWSDDSLNAYRKSKDAVWNSPDAVQDFTTLARQPDLVKLDTRLKKIRDDELLSGIKGEDVITGRQKIGNKMVNQVQTKYTADPEDVHTAYLNEYDINKDFKHRLNQQYGSQIPQGIDDQTKKALLVNQFVKGLGEISKYGPVKDNADREGVRPSFHDEMYFRKFGTWPTGDNTAGQNATAIIAENMRNSDPSKFTSLLKNTVPKEQWAKGQDIQASTDVDPQTGQQIHVFKFPDKVTKDTKAEQHNQTVENSYNKNPEKEGSILGFGGKAIPFKQSEFYKKQIAKSNILPETKVVKDNSQPYKIPTGDPQAYGIGVASMLKEQGASEAEINKILGKTGVHPVKLGEQPKTTEPKIKVDPAIKFY